MKYRVRHVTTHHYSSQVLLSQQAFRLTPRDDGRQRRLDARLIVDPEPTDFGEGRDYFGNDVAYRTLQAPHRTLTVTAESLVEVAPPRPVGASPPWEDVRALLRDPAGAEERAAAEFIHDSTFAIVSAAITAYAARSFLPGRPIVEAVCDLTRRIHTDFTYDPQATTASTVLAEVLEMRRGVCQDFAHLEIAALRAMGLAARYVGGYLLTRPPPGQPKLVGSDASHAWVSVWIPIYGWLDIDPTNDQLVRDEHIVCALGRDFEDVSPIRGVVVGGGEHALRIAVDVAAVR